MCPPFPSDELVDLRRNARLLTEQAGDQEAQLEAFVAVVERDKRSAEAAVSQTADELDEDEVRQLLDGIEATRLIKAGKATRDARVIAYTGNPSFDDGPTRALFTAVLTKPSTPGAVLATVQHVAGL